MELTAKITTSITNVVTIPLLLYGGPPEVQAGFIAILPGLLWFFLTVVAIGAFHRQLRTLILAISARIEAGAPIEIIGMKFGAPLQLGLEPARAATSEGLEGSPITAVGAIALRQGNLPEGITHRYTLVHEARPLPRSRNSNRNLWRVRVALEGYPNSDSIGAIDSVTYRLDDTFPNPVISTKARGEGFEAWMNLYGEINIVAFVQPTHGNGFWLTRLINLPGRPLD